MIKTNMKWNRDTDRKVIKRKCLVLEILRTTTKMKF